MLVRITAIEIGQGVRAGGGRPGITRPTGICYINVESAFPTYIDAGLGATCASHKFLKSSLILLTAAALVPIVLR